MALFFEAFIGLALLVLFLRRTRNGRPILKCPALRCRVSLLVERTPYTVHYLLSGRYAMRTGHGCAVVVVERLVRSSRSRAVFLDVPYLSHPSTRVAFTPE